MGGGNAGFAVGIGIYLIRTTQEQLSRSIKPVRPSQGINPLLGLSLPIEDKYFRV
jgi:hypothetical protein